MPAKYFRTTSPTPAPAISIVTPSFEQGRFIERTIASVVRQRYPALEYVVQDGGSTDETLDILRRSSGYLARCASSSDAGQADAINRGFEGTTGEIMGWLNADDLSLPGALSYVASYFDRHPGADVVYGQRILIDEHDREIGRWILPGHSATALMVADYVPQETMFWRRRVWDAAGAHVDSSLHYALDWDLLLRFHQAGACIVRLPRFLGAFRVHARQKSAFTAAIAAESGLLRERAAGRRLDVDEVIRVLRPYLLRHVVLHTAWRLAAAARFPSQDAAVDLRPLPPYGESEE